MNIVKLYAELQINPRNQVVYRAIMDYYRRCNQGNEAEAFAELIRRKFDDHSTPADQEQRSND